MIRQLLNSILNKKPSAYKQIDSLDGLRAIAVLLVYCVFILAVPAKGIGLVIKS